jgi:hypothetical protein
MSNDESYRTQLYSYERYLDRPGLEKQKKPDGEEIQEHMRQHGVPGIAKRDLTAAELLEEGIVIETVHDIPKPSRPEILPEPDAIADERKVQSDIDHVIKQYDKELDQLRRSGLNNEAAYRDILRRRKKAIRTEGAWQRTSKGSDYAEEKPNTKNALRDAVGQKALQFGYRIEMIQKGYQLSRQATREKIGVPTSLNEIAKFLIAKHGR